MTIKTARKLAKKTLKTPKYDQANGKMQKVQVAIHSNKFIKKEFFCSWRIYRKTVHRKNI